MGILDLFKAKENNELKEEIKELKKLLNPEQQEIANLVKEIDKLKLEKDKISKEVDKLLSKKQDLSNKIKLKKKDLILLDDEILMQEFGLYKPIYDFESSEKYKQAIDNLRVVQKEMIKNKSAVIYSNNWTVD